MAFQGTTIYIEVVFSMSKLWQF